MQLLKYYFLYTREVGRVFKYDSVGYNLWIKSNISILGACTYIKKKSVMANYIKKNYYVIPKIKIKWI